MKPKCVLKEIILILLFLFFYVLLNPTICTGVVAQIYNNNVACGLVGNDLQVGSQASLQLVNSFKPDIIYV